MNEPNRFSSQTKQAVLPRVCEQFGEEYWIKCSVNFCIDLQIWKFHSKSGNFSMSDDEYRQLMNVVIFNICLL